MTPGANTPQTDLFRVTTNPDLHDLVHNALVDGGFDGLFNVHEPCACLIGDLAPCGQFQDSCEAGYRHEGCDDECGLGCDFHVRRERPLKGAP